MLCGALEPGTQTRRKHGWSGTIENCIFDETGGKIYKEPLLPPGDEKQPLQHEPLLCHLKPAERERDKTIQTRGEPPKNR